MTLRVLAVDDSAVFRDVIVNVLSRQPDINVVGTAPDPYIARDKIVRLQPDVITLDIAMPRMDGITFLRKLMRFHPLPVIVLSSLTAQNADVALQAVYAGAMEVIAKPGPGYSVDDLAIDLADKIRAVAAARMPRAEKPAVPRSSPRIGTFRSATGCLIAIGASTGGVQAIEQILGAFPENAPPTLVVQHIPAHFSASFAARLNDNCAVEVREAQDNDTVRPGLALIAPGDRQMILRRTEAGFRVEVKPGPRVMRHRPSVDVLFKSVAACAGDGALGALLTGMGADGADGLLDMRRAGAYTIAQDKETSIVHGMPAEAIKRGAACDVLPLDRIAETLLVRAQRGKGPGGRTEPSPQDGNKDIERTGDRT